MSKTKVFLILQSILCLLLAALLAAGAVGIYREGAAARAAGDSFARIYTRENVAKRLNAIAPLFIAAVGMTLAGLILGIRGGEAEKRAQAAKPRPAARPELGAEITPAESAAGSAGKGLLALRIVLMAAAVGFIVAGVLNGGMRDVLAKAVYVCTECVGLG